MTTVAFGTTSVYTLALNELATLALTGSNQARVIVTDGTTGLQKYGTTTSVSDSFGPFNAGDVLRVTATRGSVDYIISTYVPPSNTVGVSAFVDLIDAGTADIVGTNSGVSALAASIAAKLSTAVGWPAATNTNPTLVTGTALNGSFLGVNSVVNTSAGVTTLGTAIDGITITKFGDVWVNGIGGGSAWTCYTGPTNLGIFASTGALPTASANTGCIAQVGAGAPYTLYVSNGSSWATVGGSTTLAALSDIGSYDLGANNPSVTSIKTTANAAIPAAQKAVASGVATLDGSVHLLAAQLPALTGDVTNSAGSAATTITQSATALNTQTNNAQSGTTYTFVLTDAGQNVDLSNAGAITATIPPHSSVAYPNGIFLYWTQVGAGTVTIAPGSGVAFTKPTARALTTSAQLEGGWAYQVSQDNWRIYNN